MDLKKFLSKVNTGVKVASAVLDNKKVLNSNVALAFLFDRRFSSASDYFNSTESLQYLDRRDFPALAEREIITFSNGHDALKGYLYFPKNQKPRGIVIVVHGLFSLADSYGAIFQNHFLERGYAVFAIDLTGSGESGGLSVPGLHQSSIDIAAAEAYLHHRFDTSSLPICLFGHRWGGYGVVASLHYDSCPVAIASLSGFRDPFTMMMALPRSYAGPIVDMTKDELHKALMDRTGEAGFLSAAEELQKNKKVPTLLIHGTEDTTINPEAAGLIAESYGRNVKKMLCQGKKHGDIFFSPEACKAFDAWEPQYKAFTKENGKNLSRIDKEKLSAFVSTFDKAKFSELDKKIFDEIDAMFDKATGKKKFLG